MLQGAPLEVWSFNIMEQTKAVEIQKLICCVWVKGSTQAELQDIYRNKSRFLLQRHQTLQALKNAFAPTLLQQQPVRLVKNILHCSPPKKPDLRLNWIQIRFAL